MKVEDAIKIRRSIRKYKDTAVPDDLINELIEAARLAPSGHNTQPWRFFIVKDEATKKKLESSGVFEQDFVTKAPVLIACCGDPAVYGKHKNPEGFGDSVESSVFRDVSIASSFLVLRATELGLGTCYIGWRHKEKIKEVLNIPKRFMVPFVITLGYPAEKPIPRPRKKLEEIILNR